MSSGVYIILIHGVQIIRHAIFPIDKYISLLDTKIYFFHINYTFYFRLEYKTKNYVCIIRIYRRATN